MGIEFNAGEWAVFFFRILHIVAAIAWIGASFYFVWQVPSYANFPEI